MCYTHYNAYCVVHIQQVPAVRFSPDGSTLALGCGDNSIHLFAVTAQGRRYRRAGVCRGHTAEVYSILHYSIHNINPYTVYTQSYYCGVHAGSFCSTSTCARLQSKQLCIDHYSRLPYVCTAIVACYDLVLQTSSDT
jgi:WD40 repeat protein